MARAPSAIGLWPVWPLRRWGRCCGCGHLRAAGQLDAVAAGCDPPWSRRSRRARLPGRPNPIGLHRVRIPSVDGAAIGVAGLVAVDGTPVVQLNQSRARAPWSSAEIARGWAWAGQVSVRDTGPPAGGWLAADRATSGEGGGVTGPSPRTTATPSPSCAGCRRTVVDEREAAGGVFPATMRPTTGITACRRCTSMVAVRRPGRTLSVNAWMRSRSRWRAIPSGYDSDAQAVALEVSVAPAA
jgi:hypothetical protein